jgi:GH25 family lysozyme M1 (1,4-beta-N-acetylmuramidase)
MRLLTKRGWLRAAVCLVGLFTGAASAPEASAQNSLDGIDVSGWQGSIDWWQVYNSGIAFAFVKATEGTGFTDAWFYTNWANLWVTPIYQGPYHFGHPGWDPIVQADFFCDTVAAANGGTFSGSLQLVLDIEVTDGTSPSHVRSWIVDFCNEVQARTGRPGTIYTGFYFWRDQAGNGSNLNCPLWLAAYVSDPRPYVPAAWSTWTFWQYTSSGRVPGISGNVDRDVSNGGYGLLNALTIP